MKISITRRAKWKCSLSYLRFSLTKWFSFHVITKINFVLVRLQIPIRHVPVECFPPTGVHPLPTIRSLRATQKLYPWAICWLTTFKEQGIHHSKGAQSSCGMYDLPYCKIWRAISIKYVMWNCEHIDMIFMFSPSEFCCFNSFGYIHDATLCIII